MSALPLVSLIVPARDEGDYIEETLRALMSQDYPAEKMEVLVIDGLSTDDTRAVVERVDAETSGRRVRLLTNPERTTPHALNVGLAEASGDVIVLVGAHCRLSSDYVTKAVEILEQGEAACIGGVLRSVGKGRQGEAIALAMSSPFGVGPARFRYSQKGHWADTVAFGVYRRDVFDKVGVFDEELVRNQDDEFNFRVTQSGLRIWLEPTIHVTYEVRRSFERLFWQYFDYGKYKVRVIQKRGAVPSWRHLVPPAFVLSLAIAVAQGLFTRRRRTLKVVGGSYLAANVAATLHATKEGSASPPSVAVAFTTMHLAYGTGFLAGAWKWRKAFRKDA